VPVVVRVSRCYKLLEQRVGGGSGIFRRRNDEPHGSRLLAKIEGEERTACPLAADQFAYTMGCFGRA
jgi:hypothetical protein